MVQHNATVLWKIQEVLKDFLFCCPLGVFHSWWTTKPYLQPKTLQTYGAYHIMTYYA